MVCKANCQKFISEALPDNNHTTSVNDGWNNFTPHLNLKENFPGKQNSYSVPSVVGQYTVMSRRPRCPGQSNSLLPSWESEFLSQKDGNQGGEDVDVMRSLVENNITYHFQVLKRVNLKRKNAKRPNLMSLKKLENLVMSFWWARPEIFIDSNLFKFMKYPF